MDEKFSISGIATGLVAVFMFFLVANNINTWGFTDAEIVQTMLIAGFMALWGINQAAKSIENWLLSVGLWFFQKYPQITEKLTEKFKTE